MNRALPALLLTLSLTGCAASSPSSAPQPSTGASSAPAAAPTPTFADVTHGDAATYVWVYSYDATRRSAVVEPTIWMINPDLCEAFGIPASDGRCEQDWLTEDSRTRVTLATAPGITLRSDRYGDPDCMVGDHSEGTCEVDAAEFNERVGGEQDPLLAWMRADDGAITELAAVYLP